MVKQGACFAAGGKDQEAAGAWQTALIKEGDVPAVHLLLVDALLRLGKSSAAIDAIERARRRWPDDPAFKRRFIIAALAGGRQGEGMAALDALQPADADNEPALALALQVLYQAIVTSQPIESLDADRARMLRYAEMYRGLNGPSAALVDAWVAAIQHAP
jgi:predicted Zn-dependent protease